MAFIEIDETTPVYDGDDPFVAAAQVLLMDLQITHTEKILFLILCRYAIKRNEENGDKYREVWPGQKRLMAELNISENTLRNGISNLAKRGLLVLKGPRYKGRRTNTYIIRTKVGAVYTESERALARRIQPTSIVTARAAEFKRSSQPSKSEGATGPSKSEGYLPSKSEPEVIRKTKQLERKDAADAANVSFKGAPRKTDFKEQPGFDTVTPEGSTLEKSLDGSTQPGGDVSEVAPAEKKKDKSRPRRALIPPTVGETAEEEEAISNPITVDEGKLYEQVYGHWHAYMAEVRAGYNVPFTKVHAKFIKTILGDYTTGDAEETQVAVNQAIKILRVAAWDWHILRANGHWYAKQREIPTLQHVAYVRDELAAATATGFTAFPKHRQSSYFLRWLVKKTASVNPMVAKAKELGMSYAAYLRMENDKKWEEGQKRKMQR